MEYNNSNEKIDVYNLRLYEPIKLMVNNIITIKGLDNIQLKEFVDIIEFSLYIIN